MCGFVGFCGVAAGNAEQDRRIIEKMSSLIVHRGPDSAGFHLGSQIALGFRRLSIIDVREGSQPMFSEKKDVVIVFNGEIYNFEELRGELLKRGHRFSTKCDTEILVHGYEEYGTDLLRKLRGMFAFAIWDMNKQELFCARDIFGIKPFYYTPMPDGIFTVGFENERFNECGEAEHLCQILGKKITAKTITPEECFEAFPKIQYHMDEPQANVVETRERKEK